MNLNNNYPEDELKNVINPNEAIIDKNVKEDNSNQKRSKIIA